MTATVAVLGLGAMGLPMARRLADGFRIRGFDVDPQRRSALQLDGAAVSITAAEAARSASVVIVAVRTLAQAEDCLFGSEGAEQSLVEGTVVVLTSTVGTEGATGLADRLAGHGVELVDAPVSGGAQRAAEGTLLALASGTDGALGRARRVLDALASKVIVVGSRVGDGQSMKIVNQLLCGVHIAAAAEALVLARALGIDPDAAQEALANGAAGSFMLGDRGPRIAEQLAGRQPEVQSRLDIFVKDMGLVAEAADRGDVSLPVAAAAQRLFELGQQHGLAAYDDSSVALVIGDSPP